MTENSKPSLGIRILLRLASRGLAVLIGYLVYLRLGLWAGVGAGIVVWVIVILISARRLANSSVSQANENKYPHDDQIR